MTSGRRRLFGADVAVDRHGGDAAGGGDFGHGELAGVVHPLSFVDQRGCHLGFAPASPASGSGGGEAGLGAFADQGSLVLGHEREHAEDEGAVRGGGVDQPVAQRPDSDAAGLQGSDDVDQVAQVAAEPVDPPDDQGVPGTEIGQAGRLLRPVDLRAAGPVGVDLQAVLGRERVEL